MKGEKKIWRERPRGRGRRGERKKWKNVLLTRSVVQLTYLA
jgi:hypothetical protein